MTEEVQQAVRELLAEFIEQTYKDRCVMIGLIQKLVDSRAFKGQDESAVMAELEARAKDIQFEDKLDARLKERVRTLIEAWNKPPTQ